jgi:acyl dehydratase
MARQRMIDPDRLLRLTIPDIEQAYTARDTMLYAIAVGYGHDPVDERALAYCYEKGLTAAPTLPLALAHPGAWMRDLNTGIDYAKVVLSEQSLILHRRVPVEGRVLGRTRVVDVVDKGAENGAIVVFDRTLHDMADGGLIATMRQHNFCRGDGGFGGTRQPTPPRSALSESPPDRVIDVVTRPEAALLYRLSADPNPLHVEPQRARAAGFPRPILHGLASFGMVGQALLAGLCDYDADRLTAVSARFAAPVFPGENFRIELWQGTESWQFRAVVATRGAVILRDGLATVRDA